MTRKEIEKDSDRPHYYSQFWLDVAAGRRIIGTPKGDESEIAEPDVAELVMPSPSRRSAPVRPDIDQSERYNHAEVDGHHEVIAHPVVDPVVVDDDIVEPAELDIINDEAENLDIQDSAITDGDIPDMDLEPFDDEEATEEEEEDFLEEAEEEEEEDTGWNRGRKKPSPKRPTKQPAKKPGKREPRRGF